MCARGINFILVSTGFLLDFELIPHCGIFYLFFILFLTFCII
jgi:hypothetical protein